MKQLYVSHLASHTILTSKHHNMPPTKNQRQTFFILIVHLRFLHSLLSFLFLFSGLLVASMNEIDGNSTCRKWKIHFGNGIIVDFPHSFFFLFFQFHSLFFSSYISFAFNIIAIIYCYFRLWMRDVKWNNRRKKKIFVWGVQGFECVFDMRKFAVCIWIKRLGTALVWDCRDFIPI